MEVADRVGTLVLLSEPQAVVEEAYTELPSHHPANFLPHAELVQAATLNLSQPVLGSKKEKILGS